MKRFIQFLVVIILLLAACSPNTNAQPGTDSSAQSVEIALQYPNIAHDKSVIVSSLTLKGLPTKAVDGNKASSWNAGKSAPQWIQVDIGSFAIIHGIRLTVSQETSSATIHQILVGASATELQLVHEFSGTTSDQDVLEFFPATPLSNVQYVKILTTQSLSSVAWGEIEIFGEEGQPTPTMQPVAVTADTIYYHGTILTMEKSQPVAEAIAIKGDTILAVGSESEVMVLKGDGTSLIDLQGMTLTPGFIDSHAHRIGDRWQIGNLSMEQVMEKALSQGWTSIHELFVTSQVMNELVNFDRVSTPLIRVSMYLTSNFEYTYDKWWQAFEPLQQYSPYLQIAGLKITLDREWGEQIFFSQEQFSQMVLDGTGRGWQIATHAFSPAANQIVLNGYALGLKGGNNDVLRLRLEHIGTMTDNGLRKMSELGIIGSVQLINSGSFPDDASFKKYIPTEEVPHTARWRDLKNAGILLIGNTDDTWCCTDWRNNFQGPSFDATVMDAIFQGVTFNTFKGRKPEPWQTAQALTVQEALEMMTINGAYAAHQENVIGSLKPGKYADLVILSSNPLTTPIEAIPNIQVVMTMVGGDVKYCAENQENICHN